MKKLLLSITALSLTSYAFADDTEVKIKSKISNSDDNQAIVISKQKIKDSNEDLTKKFEIVKETAEIEGDDAITDSIALANWKQACNDWKKEIRELNKQNSLIQINCGKREKHSTDMGKKQYVSQASFTAKVQVRE
jgi:hypothetical protein